MFGVAPRRVKGIAEPRCFITHRTGIPWSPRALRLISIKFEKPATAIQQPSASTRSAPPVALATMSSIHWSDGGIIDLERVQEALRPQGGKLLVDATHAAGVVDLDVTRLDPDFLIFPTYKWLLGPYGRAFLYVAKRCQNGIPLEQTSYGRKRVQATDDVYFSDLDYVETARRFDMGERDFFVSLDVASTSMCAYPLPIHGVIQSGGHSRMGCIAAY